MLLAQVQGRWLVEFIDLTIDTGTNKALRHQVRHQLHMLALAITDNWREQHQLRAFRQSQHLVDHLADGLRFKIGVVIGAARYSGPRIQKPQVVVDLGDRADR